MNLRLLSLAGLALAATLAPAGSRAQNLEVSPVVVEVSAGAPSAIMTVKNVGKTPMRYQVRPYAWTEGREGQTQLEPAKDLAVFPELFQLPAGESKKVRIGATVPPGAAERTWRLMVEEIPDAVETAQRSVRIQTRFSVPVFLAPRKLVQKVEYALRLEGKAGLRLVASNQGSVRSRPGSIRVRLYDGDRAELKVLDVTSWYVLAGAERAYEVAVPSDLCGRVRRADVVVDAAVVPAQEFPDGVCAAP